jgi:hypothetical protein
VRGAAPDRQAIADEIRESGLPRRPSGAQLRRVCRLNRALAILLASALFATAALAHGHGEQFADWYMSLTRPGGGSCCSLSDGRTTDVRVRDGHYEAWIDERFPYGEQVKGWVEIKPEAVLNRTDNPTGEPVVFWTPYQGVLCFVRAVES